MINETIQQDNIDVENEVQNLFGVGAHFGHKKSKGHPKMKPYVFTTRNGVQIMDLYKTVSKLQEVSSLLRDIISNSGVVLFVGTKPAAKNSIQEVGQKTGMPYVTERWLGGTLTNFKVISGRIKHMEDLEKRKASGDFEKYTKKEKTSFEEELQKLKADYDGLRSLKNLPHALFVVDAVEEDLAVKEANKLNIPVVALSDTDANPEVINHIIPANDDSLNTVEYIMKKIGDIISSTKSNVNANTDHSSNQNTNKEK